MLCNSLCLQFVSALFMQGAFAEGTLHEVHACEVLEAASAKWTAQDALTRTRGHFCFHFVISLNRVAGSCIEGDVTIYIFNIQPLIRLMAAGVAKPRW